MKPGLAMEMASGRPGETAAASTSSLSSLAGVKRLLLCLGVALAAIWIYWGWRTFWFLTDDAYIAFRYARNLLNGYGPVWNPAPFRPVEGYSSFSWVILLAGVWKLTGIAPPETANVIGLWCGYATLVFVFLAARRVRLAPRIQSRRWLLFGIIALGLLTNRHFFTWLSSGLETPLFNLCVSAWMYYGLFPDADRDTRHTQKFTAWMSAVALSRPDGLLFIVATLTQIFAVGLFRKNAKALWRGAWPALASLAHLAFRLAYYREWLTNTYYAKYTEPWPQAGLRYSASFLVENGLWFWLCLAVVWAVVAGGRWWRWPARPPLGVSITVATAVAHAAYFTFVIGGDHFEYRVYSCWLPWIFVSCVWLAQALTGRPKIAALILATVVALSWPIQWTHWYATQKYRTRHDTFRLWVPIAYRFGEPASGLIDRWDSWQRWLIHHGVGLRHQEHKVFAWFVSDFLRWRDGTVLPAWKERPVVAEPCVGILGWKLPSVAIIDRLGLNDAVIARSYPPGTNSRYLAHERYPPSGYIECFKPNLFIEKHRIRYIPRPLSDAEIRGCEEKFAP